MSDAKRRRLGRRDTEERVRRSVKDNLPGVDETQLTQHLVDGKSLLDRMCEDRRASNGDNSRHGLAYFAQLRVDYALEDPESALPKADKTEAICPGLLAAMTQAKNPNAAHRTKSLLVSWMTSARILNQRMIIGLVAYLGQLHPDKNAGAAQAQKQTIKQKHT
jgi:hypothetical protein